MSLQAVEQAATAATASHVTLKVQCRAAVEAGIPISKVAQAAGVTRTTVYAWLKESA